MSEYVITQGDLTTPIVAILADHNGPLDLNVQDIVYFQSRKLNDESITTLGLAEVVSPGAIVGNPDRGKVSYDFIADDVAIPGIYYVRWRVQFFPNPSTIIQSFPSTGSESLIILPSQ